MRTRNFLTISLLAAASTAMAQSAVDAYNITPTELRGSARFVGMGGAFTALGGDLSTMTQNPAGLGLFRRSELGLTFDVSFRNYNTTSDMKRDINKTKAYFDNIGYVGTFKLDGVMNFLQFGVSYSRLSSFDRITQGYTPSTQTSLSNYVASFTNGVNSGDLLNEDKKYDPYWDSSEDWLSILSYQSMMINNPYDADGNPIDNQYLGLFQNGTVGDALYKVHEHGYTDEYNIDFAGNFGDIVYWGLGVGIVDMSYSRNTLYSESMANALVYNKAQDANTPGNAGFDLYNDRYVTGSGANFKVGLIVRPVDMLRIGFAVHTPTYLHLRHTGYGDVSYAYTPDDAIDTSRPTENGTCETPPYDYTSRLQTPWRFMVGASLTIANQGLLSLDYERVAYNDMKLKQENFGTLGGSYVENTYANQDVKNQYKAANILRVGAEYRITPRFSVRAGYNYQTSNVKDEVREGRATVYTSGTDPSYSFDKSVNNISFGLGYRVGSWYIDATFQHTNRKSTYHAYTPWTSGGEGSVTPSASMSDNYNNLIISTGIRF